MVNTTLTVYHGSPKIIETPTFGTGNPRNDYGLGFYCTESAELAKEWACSAESDGFANRYTLDLSGLSVLSLTGGSYHILNWLSVLLENRKFRLGSAIARQGKAYIADHFSVDYRNFDVIRGYRADDSYFSFAAAFLENTISLSQLECAMVLGKLGEQIVLRSPKAFEALTFQQALPAENRIYYPKKMARDTAARSDFRGEKERELLLTDTYLLDIIREEWKNDDPRLQRIVLG
ncbi:MAG: DUF3990 domain-containing protein [Firmicutes bacterium]|nr:DUF3990 domain-containing protein [Bacillota bacterium]